LVGDLKRRDHAEDLGIDGRITLKSILAQDKDQWRAVVYMVMNLRVP
jgi:hypothetical protein